MLCLDDVFTSNISDKFSQVGYHKCRILPISYVTPYTRVFNSSNRKFLHGYLVIV